MTELPMTEARLIVLSQVRDGRISYANAAGRYCLDGSQIRGWSGRTLAALRRAGYITIGHEAEESSKSTVDLTDRGRGVLAD